VYLSGIFAVHDRTTVETSALSAFVLEVGAWLVLILLQLSFNGK
jgi:hypothetical protein